MANKNQSAFVTVLTRDNKTIKVDRAERIGKKVSNAQSKLIMELEDLISADEDRLEAMMDLSTDNKNTSLNIISPNFDAKDFVTTMQDIHVNLKINKEKLQIAQDTLSKWFE